ncbi:MAG: hypothetical protein JW889_13455 [Verrucomicrobia bacterium]|nr:hypothetical protein [Verrucomicrobiota bacterium]
MSARPALELAAHKEPGALGTFRATFSFPGGREPGRDVLVVLAPFSPKRDHEKRYDPSRLFDAASAVIGGLPKSDRVNILSCQDLLHGAVWFPKEYPFVENADDLFVQPRLALDQWASPAEAQTALAMLREHGVETVRNTSWLIELLRTAHEAFDATDGHVDGDRRVKELIVVADSFALPRRSFLAGLPVELPDIRLEPLDPEWTSALFYRLRRDQVHVDFVVVTPDEKPSFSPRHLRRMAESTRGFYLDWPDDADGRRQCVAHIAKGLHRGLEVDFGRSDANYIYTNRWSPDGEPGFVVWGRYVKPGRCTFALRDTLTGAEWPFEVVLPDTASQPVLEAEWAQQRLADGLWRLATYGRDDYLTYDLQQLAHRYGFDLPGALAPSPFDEPAAPAEVKPPSGKGREMVVPTLDAGAELPPHSALAELAPYDMIYVRYGRLRSAVQLLDMGYFYGRDVVQALGLHPDITMIEEKAQTQMCIRVSRKLTTLYEAAIAEVAVISTGATVAAPGAARSVALDEGSDICLLMLIKRPLVFRLRINQFRRDALARYPGTAVRRFRHEGVVVTETLGEHNVVRSYFAMFEHTPRGASTAQTFAVCGNSWAAVRRVIDVHAGKAPSVLANADFAEFRAKLPLAGFEDIETGSQIDENLLVYFGEPAVLTLTDWRIAALRAEQALVASHLRLLQHALRAYERDRGVLLDGARWPTTIVTTLVEEGYLPALPFHPGVGAYAYDPDHQVFYSTRYGRLGWLTPMADLIDQIGEPRYGTPQVGATAAQLAWTDDLVLARGVTRPDPKDFKFALLRALAGEATSDFSTFEAFMDRPGLAVAMKSRLLQFGKGGLGMSKTQIALNLLAGKVRGEITTALGWQGDGDPFAWADDEICVLLDAQAGDWRTALVDPPVAFGVKVKPGKEGDLARVLETSAASASRIRIRGIPEVDILTTGEWSLVVPDDSPGLLTVARHARTLERWPSFPPGWSVRAFLPERGHALIRFNTTCREDMLRTALGLYGPATESQAQAVMARFESVYGNRIASFNLDGVPMLEDAPRPAGSQYCIDPVEQRIASSVYGLPGDYLLSGRVPFDAGIREALGKNALGYGVVTVHADAIEFAGAAPNPGTAVWAKGRPKSSAAVGRQVHNVRTTRSLSTLAKAVRSNDGYLWRLGLRGFELNATSFERRLTGDEPREYEALSAWSASPDEEPDLSSCLLRNATLSYMTQHYDDFDMPVLGLFADVILLQRTALQTGNAVRHDAHSVALVAHYLGDLHALTPTPEDRVLVDATAKVAGWVLICRGDAAAEQLRAFLNTPSGDFTWPAETIGYVRDFARECLRIIEKE